MAAEELYLVLNPFAEPKNLEQAVDCPKGSKKGSAGQRLELQVAHFGY